MSFRKKITLIFITLLLLGVHSALADKTVKSVSFFGGFVSSAFANIPYSKNFIFKSPDGVETLYFAKVTFHADNPNIETARFYVKLDDQWCNPEYYDIPSGKYRYQMDFDCTNIITQEGQYEGGFQSNKNLNNIYGEWSITYKNNPKSSIASIGGTEYSSSESARVVLQIKDSGGIPINDGDCYTTIRDSSDTIKADNQTLNYINGSNGLYYYQFMITLPVGVYSADNYCSINGTNVYSGDTFHVAKWTEDIHNITTSQTFVSYVGSTEYQPTDDIALMSQFLENWGTTPVNGKYCRAKVYDGYGNVVLNLTDLAYAVGSNGVYYYTWANHSLGVGVYYVDVECSKQLQYVAKHHGSSSFHIWTGNVSVGNVSYVDVVGNVSTWSGFRLTYAGGTEYQSIQEGQVAYQFLRTIAGNPSPINNADWCNVTIWYPNNTVFVNNSLMAYLSGSNGIYYKNFTIPSVDGLYKTNAICRKSGIRSYGAGTFHVVSEWNINSTDIENLILAVNQSIYNKLYLIQDDLVYINNTLNEVNETVHNITIGNVSVEVNLTEVLNRLDRNYNYSIAMNTSVWNKLYLIQDELYNITVEIIEVQDLIVSHNQTVMNKLYLIQDDLADIVVLIDNHNTTVMNKLYLIQDDLLNITNTLIAHNTTVMNKLYLLQDDLTNINQTIVNGTFNITYPCEDQILCLLEHARILNKRVINYDKQFAVTVGGLGVFIFSGVYYIKKKREKNGD